ncbi:MAG: glycosyltransferase family 39 protein [Candidatus Accumulibacter sp.]|nr:glycosyltransferase family 39 protein [Accumulibacter sp.]
MNASSLPARIAHRLLVGGGGALLFWVSVWLVATIGWRPLMLPDEGRYVGIAWEMITSGDWWVPRLDGMPFFHKPPLFYWLTALSLEIFGAHEWAARMAPISGGILAAVGMYFFVRRYRNPLVAALVVGCLVTQPIYFAGAQFANLDMLVAGLISACILSAADTVFRLQDRRPYRAALLRTYALAAFGVLAKGLIGLVLPGGVIILWLAWRRQWRAIRLLLSLPGTAVFLAIAAPWFFSMQQRYPGFFDYFFVYQHFRRFAETGFNNQFPGWFYLPVILVCALPWSPWILRCLPPLIRRGAPAEQNGEGVRSLMVIWLALIILFFSLPSSKLIGYILPAMPPFAFLIGESFFSWLQNNPPAARRGYSLTLALAMPCCVALIAFVALSDRASTRSLAQVTANVLQESDQLLLIDGYPYDLPFYLHLRHPPWVLGDWNDPQIDQHDNWRKELADAGKFDLETRADHLLLPEQVPVRLCRGATGAVWVWGRTENRSAAPWLPRQAMVHTVGKYSLWRLTPADLNALAPCSEKPTNG